MSALNLKHRHPFIDGLEKHPEGKKKDMIKIKNWWVRNYGIPLKELKIVSKFRH